MSTFDEWLERDISVYEGRHDDLIFQAPALYRLLTSMLDDPVLPDQLRTLVISGIAYFILPNDIIPEEIYGPYGYVDDIFLAALVADKVRRVTGSDDIITGNWDGEADILSLIDEVLEREGELISDNKGKILKYVGLDATVFDV